MADVFDLSVDALADAPLTDEQRRVWNAMRGALASARAENQTLSEALKKRETQKVEDDFVSILTRADFNREVARMLAFDERYGGMSSILYFDIEGMDEVVTRFGQPVADVAAREIVTILVQGVRTSDIIGRLAPNEFGILLMRCDNASAWKKAEILTSFLQQALEEIQGCALSLRISYGAYTFRDNEDLAVGLKEAAMAMTNSKKA